ncbi:surface lipoprotein assembly modifier [Novosphingobium naphthalenivorans]|uniref:surface lipoprotein assembly modifier n=1 Tax=Novosphingobium naphthalenivorans TaxID=273168 RepID=UPI000A007824|nr:surface lipoprotein assembly modifier [Novosphingobium naphthalenivorans]
MSKVVAAAALVAVPVVVHAQDVRTSPAQTPARLSAAQVFALADAARAKGDFATAEAAYHALESDPDPELRTEARFRLGMMLADDLHRYTDAAIAFRRILDDKPGAARVRLELARVLAMTGDMRAAEREFRAAEAAGLPPQVERMVRFYANALNARKPFGGSFEVALAPDSNINRATRSDTLGTVIGDFTLDKDAQAKSGVGLDLRGQAYWREGLEKGTDLLVRVSGGGSLYRDSAFNDISTGLQIGPQYASGKDRITLAAGPTWRWYGKSLYSLSYGGTANWQHPTGKRSQLRIEGGITHVENKRNALQVADDFTLSASLDRAFSARMGGGVQVYGFREAARDPGYSLASGGASVYVFREVGRTTLIGTAGYSHLEADARLFLYPHRRVEDRYSASLAATLRALHVGAFAPLVRVKWERNRSSIEIYDYKRVSAELGVSSAF